MAEVALISVPGCILNNPQDGIDSVAAVCEYIEANEESTSFLAGDVFSFNGNKTYTVVVVNRISPVWHFVAMPYDEFLKAMM